MMPERTYSAKLLLFGEHVLLIGEPALAVPVPIFSGKWASAFDEEGWAKNALLADFVAKLPTAPRLDMVRLRADMERGLYFHSNIPQGYGLGSSGALCAALYDGYALEKTTDLAQLKAQLGQLESPLHGQSSGIDPLTCYVNQPLHIVERTQVTLPVLKGWAVPKQPVLFLVDTALPRRTGPLVSWFLAQSQADTPFAAQLHAHYVPAHRQLVDAWLRAEAQAFWAALHTVSAAQWAHWTPMIPAHEGIQHLWKKGLETGDFLLKICGAGGGGFVLGFAKNREVVAQAFATYQVIII